MNKVEKRLKGLGYYKVSENEFQKEELFPTETIICNWVGPYDWSYEEYPEKSKPILKDFETFEELIQWLKEKE